MTAEHRRATESAANRNPDIIVIGGSSGSFVPIRAILKALPRELPVSIFVTLHVAANRRFSTTILAQSSPFPVVVPRDGDRFAERTLYVAPPDEHMMFDADGCVRVLHGPRENGARPSIDSLFRSAAVTFGPRVVGLLLSGHLFDGAAGLDAIKRCGGVTMVQDPSDALEPELPSSALSASLPDYCLPADQLGSKLPDIIRALRGPPIEVPADLRAEARLALAAGQGPISLDPPGTPVPITCPACDGPLRELDAGGYPHFRCEVGHTFGVDALLVEQSRSLERALWIALRTLQERGVMLRRMSDEASSRGFASSAESYEQRRQEIEEHVFAIRRVIGGAAKDIAPPIAAPPIDD